MKNDLVSRSAIRAKAVPHTRGERAYCADIRKWAVLVADIDDAPAVDAVPVVHGRWMHEETEGGFHIWRCSRCGIGMNDNPEGIDLYCYHCGARMDGSE